MATSGRGSRADLDNWFAYHAPDAEKARLYETVRAKAKELAMIVVEQVPESADRTAALRDIRNTVMAINLAIACNS
jgi:hypothetical protein